MNQAQFEIIDDQLGGHWIHSYSACSWKSTDWPDLQTKGFCLGQQGDETFLLLNQQRHGLCESYYPQGQLRSSSYYELGLLHGPVHYYSVEGSILAKSYYVKGKKWGPFRLWYLQGSLYSEQHYQEGEKEGLHSYYFESGSLQAQMSYKKGVLEGQLKQWHEDGSLRRCSEFQAGIRNGIDHIWSAQGYPLLQATYVNGQPTGQLSYYHNNGTLAERYSYLGPAWQFHVQRFDQEGQLWQEGISHEDHRFEQKSYDAQEQLIEHIIYHRDSQGKTLSSETLFKKSS